MSKRVEDENRGAEHGKADRQLEQQGSGEIEPTWQRQTERLAKVEVRKNVPPRKIGTVAPKSTVSNPAPINNPGRTMRKRRRVWSYPKITYQKPTAKLSVTPAVKPSPGWL